jgi:nitrite reductase (NADH) large subunit
MTLADGGTAEQGETMAGAVPLRLVVIGNGMAGCRAVEELLARDPGRYPHHDLRRRAARQLQPHHALAGPGGRQELRRYRDQRSRLVSPTNAIDLIAGDPVVAIDAKRRRCARSGGSRGYDKLLIATGSDPFIIPVPGMTLHGVVSFRDMDDVDRCWRAADCGGDAVVIGGGLLGLEAAHGLSPARHEGDRAAPDADPDGAPARRGSRLAAQVRAGRRGQTILTGADTAEIIGGGKVEGVRLKDGTLIPASLVVMAVGIRPSVALARDAGLAMSDAASRVDDHMVTSDPQILAVGECVEHDGQVYGLVAPLWDMCRASPTGWSIGQAAIAARSRRPSSRSRGSTSFRRAIFRAATAAEDIVMRDASRGIYKRVVVKRRPHRRRGALWRYRRRQLVFRPAEEAARISRRSATC